MAELKPCPFCGGYAELRQTTNGLSRGRFLETWEIKCEKCGANAGKRFNSEFFRDEHGKFIFEKDGRADAISAWNRRYESERI